MTLLKAGFFEIWLVRVAPLITISGSEIDFGTGDPFHLSHLHCMGREQMFWEELFDFVRGFNSLQLIKEEVALFTAVLMLSAGKYNETLLNCVIVRPNSFCKTVVPEECFPTLNHGTWP